MNSLSDVKLIPVAFVHRPDAIMFLFGDGKKRKGVQKDQVKNGRIYTLPFYQDGWRVGYRLL